MKNNKKIGISLIVLVITIIVMIILATAIILSLSGSDIIGKANEAKTSSDMANAKHVVALAQAEWKLDGAVGEFSDYAERKLEEAGYKVGIGTGLLEVTNAGDLYVYPKIPEGFVASQVETEDQVSEGLVIYEGTSAVTELEHENAMENRNQYVWVPVMDINQFVFKDGYKLGEVQSLYFQSQEPYTVNDVSALSDIEKQNYELEKQEYEDMIASVKNNYGFYIARYEAGDATTESARTVPTEAHEVVSMKNQHPYNFVPISETRVKIEPFNYEEDDIFNVAGAIYLSRNLYNQNKDISSCLIYGVQWDAALSFISKTDPLFSIDSTGKGYYGTLYDKETGEYKYLNNPKAQKTGIHAINNIYDMAGNISEWTMEIALYNEEAVQQTGVTHGFVFRGGNFTNEGYGTTASNRSTVPATYGCEERWGFRTALYLK